MKTEAEFLEEMLERIPRYFKSKRQFVLKGLRAENAQMVNHWITRGKVPGDWKPQVAALLEITDWLPKTNNQIKEKSGSRYELQGELQFHGVDFALTALELIKEDPEFAEFIDKEWLAKAFITLYKAYSDDKLREVDPKVILRLVA